jgi:hypothetical protein
VEAVHQAKLVREAVEWASAAVKQEEKKGVFETAARVSQWNDPKVPGSSAGVVSMYSHFARWKIAASVDVAHHRIAWKESRQTPTHGTATA